MLKNNHLFSEIGIDSIGFHAPRFYAGEDVISMGLRAAYSALQKGSISPKSIDGVFVGTETVTYAVKSVSNIFAGLLGISSNSITQDIYNASAGGTLAIINAIALVERGMCTKALVICADVSSYDIENLDISEKGSGAIALVISRNPRIATFSKQFGKVSVNVNNFFQSNERENAHFGNYSVDSYLNFQLSAYDNLMESIGDFHADYYAFHAPYDKLPIMCMQQIIQKRWIKHIKNLTKLRKRHEGSSLLKKLNYFLHDLTILPEYIYLKLQEKGRSFEALEHVSHALIRKITDNILPHLRIPSHFGDMYNASVWAQILYIFEQYGRKNDTIYFGSYGSGATCISGLLKIQPYFKSIVEKGPKVSNYIKIKEKRSIRDYKPINRGILQPNLDLGYIIEHEDNDDRGFTLHFCDNGCIIPDIRGLDRCPKGHPGFHTRFFPLYAILESNPLKYPPFTDLSFLNKGLVRLAPNLKKGAQLEYELRRVNLEKEGNHSAIDLLDWAPMYYPTNLIHSK